MRKIEVVLAVLFAGSFCSPAMGAGSVVVAADVQEACAIDITFVGCTQRPAMAAPEMVPVEAPAPKMRVSCAFAILFVGCVGPRMGEQQVPSLKNAPPPEIQQECGLAAMSLPLAWAVPFAGCIEHPALEVTRLDQLQNSYEVAHRTMWFNFSSDAALKREIEGHAGQVCAPGSVATVVIDSPDYISVPMSPRGYVYCGR